MVELLLIKSSITKELKNFLAEKHIEYEIFSNYPHQEKVKEKEGIFADYGEALKDKELEREKKLLEQADEEAEYEEYEQED